MIAQAIVYAIALAALALALWAGFDGGDWG